MSAFEIRAATTADEDGLFHLAQHLNTVNRPADRARYDYLRGMGAYRSDDWREGRHYLGLAVAVDELDPGSLDDASRDRALQALERMDKAVFRDGYATAAKAPASSFDPEDAAKAKKSKRPSGARDDDDADDGD